MESADIFDSVVQQKNIQWTLLGRKNIQLRWRFWCSRYLASRAGQVLRPRRSRGSPLVGSWRRNIPVDCSSHNCFHYIIQKNLQLSLEVLVFALPIFPGSHPPSIVGVNELNFCVRDGNRWTLATINTNYNGFNHYLLVTHTGFEPMLTA